MKKRTIVAILTTAVLAGATVIAGFTGAYAQKNKETGSTISLEEAKELALAKVPGASDIRIRYDEYDGQYEGVILFEEKEYELAKIKEADETIAAPVMRTIFENVLPYLGIEKTME